MAGVNKAIIIGNLGRDPELRYTSSGTPVCSLSIATSRKYRDRKTNNMVEETDWHRVSVFGQQAEHCNNYLHKGRQVYVEGRMRTRKFEDKEGITRWNTEVVADRVQFLGRSPGGGQSTGNGYAGGGQSTGSGPSYAGDGQGGWFDAGGEGRGAADQHDPATHRTPSGKRRGGR